jgi:hypothetical protein
VFERREFDNEQELDGWVGKNLHTFLGDGIVLDGFQIVTRRNKAGVPDWFFLDLADSSWCIIESELISHGVWNHIAEQVVRFIVAAKSDESKKAIRNGFFREIERRDEIKEVSSSLGIPQHRLLEHIETIIEGTLPDLVIFIDDVNEDLMDMVDALNVKTHVYRLMKFEIDGKTTIVSPDKERTVFQTEEDTVQPANPLPAINTLGGGHIVERIGSTNVFKLANGENVIAKYSKRYNAGEYWFAMYPASVDAYRQKAMDSIIFLLGSEGFAKVPLRVIDEYLNEAHVTRKDDGTIQKYHIRIKATPDFRLAQTRTGREWPIDDYYYAYLSE